MAFATMRRKWKREKELWLLCIPFVVWIVTFSYYPMMGFWMAFVNFTPGVGLFQSEFVGLAYFEQFFRSPDFWQIMRNTLAIGALNVLVCFPAPIILALLLHEAKNARFRRIVQTLSYLPYFLSWVVMASILFMLLGNEGILNQLLIQVGLLDRPISFLGEGKYFWSILTSANLWKDTGWVCIIYLSAIAGIDKELYEAGKVDGLGRFGLVRHVTLPGIRIVIALMWILSISNILSQGAGIEPQLLIGTPQTRDYNEVLDSYAYRFGIQLGNYSYGQAVTFFKATIAFILLVMANRFAKKRWDAGIF